MSGDDRLDGLSVLLVEDSYYIAHEALEALKDAGAQVLGPFRDLAEAAGIIERERVDCALVDINLGDGPTFDPARALVAAGVRIIFMTGYDEGIIPEDLRRTPYLQKPVAPHRLVSSVAAVCRP